MDQPTYLAFQRALVTAIWRDLDPLSDEIEASERLPYDRLMPALRAMGAFGLLIPEAYGGAGLTARQYVPIIAEFAKISGGIRVLVHAHNTMAHALSKLGSDQQRRDVLPGAAQGARSVAFALTEPDAGSGADIATRAVREGGAYVVTGRKWFITNSDFASHFILFVKTGTGRGEGSVSALLVERDTPGLTIEGLPPTMGCKGGQHGLLTFERARVPVANLLGAEGSGLAQMEQTMALSRLFIAATSLGTAERAFELSLAHARRRVTFGKPIADRQAIQRYLAEMATDIYAMRQMIRDTAAKADRGAPILTESAMCKLFGLEAVARVTDRALLIHGGVGYTRMLPIERLYRDARLNWLEEGTPTIQHMVTARAFLNGYTWDDDVGDDVVADETDEADGSV
jgi:alkylation response protein AidB-like acyl-CoA dehydrogenase